MLLNAVCLFISVTSVLSLLIFTYVFSRQKRILQATIEALKSRSNDLQATIEALKSRSNDLEEKLKREPSYDAQALLQDMLNGYGLVKVTRLSPLDFFIKSPKG